MKPTLVIMAAGMGSRYGGLKQVDPVGPNDEIVIDYAIYDAIQAGFGKVVFIIRHDIEEVFKDTIGRRVEKQLPVEYAFQELDMLPEGYSIPAGREKPWGTGHAVLCARDVIHEPFAVINADDFYGRSSYRVLHDFLAAADPRQAEYGLVGFVLNNTLSDHGSVARGVCESTHDYLKTVVEYTKIEKTGDGAVNKGPEGERNFTGDELVSMNMWGFTENIFEALEMEFKSFLDQQGQEMKSEYLIPSIVDDLIKKDEARVKILPSQDKWFGVTYQEDKPVVIKSIAELVDKGVYPSPLWG